MDKAIITVLLIICGVVATLAIFNGIMPAVNQGQSAIANAANQASDRMESRIQIIHVSSVGSQVKLWVKNVGSTTIVSINRSDLLFGSSITSVLVSYGGTLPPYWAYEITGGNDEWAPTVTLDITINLAAPLSAGTYYMKMVIPNGVGDEVDFSVA